MSAVLWLAAALQEGGLYLLLLLLPFSKAAIEVAFGIILAGWLLARYHPATRRQTLWLEPAHRPLLFATLGFLGACALSIAVSSHPALSAEGFIGKWLEYLLLFVMAADLGRKPQVAERALTVLRWSAVLVIMEIVSQELTDRGLFRHYRWYTFERATGPYENPIDLATYLMVVVFSLAGFRPRSGKLLWASLHYALVGALAIYLIRTEALGAWVAMAGAILVLCCLDRRLWRWGAALVLALGAGSSLWLAKVQRLQGLLTPSDVGMMDRWVMWQAALGMIRARPLLGHGVNTFMANYLTYWVGGERQPRYAHNCYLQVAAETGLVGLLFFAGLLGLLFRQLFAGLRRLASEERLLLLGLTAGLLAFAIQAGIETNFYALRQAALFWVMAGLALGLSAR